MSQLINETIEAFDLFSQGMLSEEDIYNGIQAGLISESLFNELSETYLYEEGLSEGIIDTMSFDKAGKRKVADALFGGSIVNHLIDRSHHKEIAEKLINSGVKPETLKKVKMLKDFAHREPSSTAGRTLRNIGRTATKLLSLSNPIGAALGHSIHKTHMRDLRDKLKQAGLSDSQIEKVHELKKKTLY